MPETDAGEITEVERTFTCTACGYGERREVAPLVAATGGVCVECGDWTTGTADLERLVAAARDVAATLSGPAITERQALAYLLREVVGVGRQDAAAAMDTSASNVDNLQRRGAERVAAARRLVDGLAAARGENRSANADADANTETDGDT